LKDWFVAWWHPLDVTDCLLDHTYCSASSGAGRAVAKGCGWFLQGQGRCAGMDQLRAVDYSLQFWLPALSARYQYRRHAITSVGGIAISLLYWTSGTLNIGCC